MRTGRAAWVAVAMVAMPVTAVAEDWVTVETGRITVKSRTISGSVKEVWAEGTLNASVVDLQDAILDAEAYPSFMPYVKESRFIGDAEPDGSRYTYTRLDVPFVSSRDYVLKVAVESRVDEQGNGVFRNTWAAVPNRLPRRANSTRLETCDGSWQIKATEDGKAYAVYKAIVDPGGWVPAFAADAANKRGVADTWNAVEKEAQRRGAARVARVAKQQEQPKPAVPGA